MRIKEYDFDIDNADADGLFKIATLLAGGAITLDGDLIVSSKYVAADGLGHKIDIICAGNEVGRTFTITGVDQDGNAQADPVAGVATNTAQSAVYFKEITGITSDDATAGDITIGTTDEVQSKILPVDSLADNRCRLSVNITGTIDYDIQYTSQPILQPNITPVWNQYDISGSTAPEVGPDFTGQTADQEGLLPLHVSAWKLVVNSYTNGAELQITRNQPTNS